MSEASESARRSTDLRILWHLLFSPVRGKTHAQRLESFYRDQAPDYDSFRHRLLHGREPLISLIEFPDDGVWVDMGAGTGHNLVLAGKRATRLRQIELVDLSPSLLEVARKKIHRLGLDNVRLNQSDVTSLDRPPASVDLMTFSYSLTMIPDWFEAIAVAERLLKPGGCLAVTDFYVSRKFAEPGQRQHGWLRRWFWSMWFASDNVMVSGDHLAMLSRRFEVEHCTESLGSVPYFPFLQAPYYVFVGRKPE